LGTTGVRDQLADDLRIMLEKVRASTSKPIAVGVGVSTPEHVRLVAELADGVVVGSAILKLIEDLEDRADRLEHVGDFVAVLKAATRVLPAELRLPAS
jgi:tryptophan synthase alpha chain